MELLAVKTSVMFAAGLGSGLALEPALCRLRREAVLGLEAVWLTVLR